MYKFQFLRGGLCVFLHKPLCTYKVPYLPCVTWVTGDLLGQLFTIVHVDLQLAISSVIPSMLSECLLIDNNERY